MDRTKHRQKSVNLIFDHNNKDDVNAEKNDYNSVTKWGLYISVTHGNLYITLLTLLYLELKFRLQNLTATTIIINELLTKIKSTWKTG